MLFNFKSSHLKKFRVIILFYLVASLVLSGCYKEDTNALYSRQIVLAASFKDLNEQINNINKDIIELQSLYNSLKNKPVVTSLIYATNASGDTIGVTVGISGTDFYIPYGVRGKDGKDGENGKDGVNPTISISSDGYWIINGEKTTHKAIGKDGKDGVSGADGQAPIISAKLDPDAPNDQHLYWTIKYPGESTDSFLLVNGQKIRATPNDGVDGKDGATGPQGPAGPQGKPGVESFVTNIEQEGDQIKITTINGDTFVVPLREIAFKLKTDGKVDANGIIQFSEHGQVISIPYTSSDNLASIRSTLPTGWTAEPIISDDPSLRVINICAPKLIDLDRATFAGDVVFYGLDEKGMVITQFTKVKLQKKIYLSYFYNPLDAVELGRANSPFNVLELPAPNVKMEQVFYALQGTAYNKTQLKEYGTGISEEDLSISLHQYPSYSFPKNDADVDKSYKLVVGIYNPDSLDRTYINNLEDSPDGYIFYVKKYENTEDYRPVPYNTYIAQYSYALNNGSNVEMIRLKRAAAQINIYVKDYVSFMGIDAATFDVNKVKIRMNHTVGVLNSSFRSYNGGTTEITGKTKHIKYDENTRLLTAGFGILGTINGSWNIEFWYDGVKKKTWSLPMRTNRFLIEPDNIASFYLNVKQRPFPESFEMENYIGLRYNNTGRTMYVSGSIINHQ